MALGILLMMFVAMSTVSILGLSLLVLVKNGTAKRRIFYVLSVWGMFIGVFFRFQPSFQLYRPALRGALHRIVKCCRSSDSFSGQKGQHAVCSLWPDGGIGDSGNFKAVFIEKKPLPPAGAKEKTKKEKRL